MYLWHSPANEDGIQSDPSQSKSCQHALLEHINGTVYPWGNQTHTHTPIYKNIISHPLVQTFRQKERCIRCQFQLQSLLCYYFLYLYQPCPLLRQAPQEYFSRSRFFDRPKHKFVYKQEFRKYRSHILYNNKGPEWKLPDQFKSLISLLPDK